MKLRLHLLPVAATTMILAGALSASAALIAYEGFEYGDQTHLGGMAGGSGWLQRYVVPPQLPGLSAWNYDSRTIVTNQATGLNYTHWAPEGALATVDNKAVVGYDGTVYPTSGGQSGTASRLLPGTLTSIVGGSGTVWISFLYENWSTDFGVGATGTAANGFREADVKFFSGSTTNSAGNAQQNGSELFSIGSPNTYTGAGFTDYMSIWSSSSVKGVSTLATPRGRDVGAVFCVIRLDINATTAVDTLYAWFNPSLAAAPNIANAVSFTKDVSVLNSLRLNAGNMNASGTNALFAVDEIRIGTAWADVAPIPEPAAFGLATLGGLALLALRRKRS